ncbi:methyltransferase domain-containing protein [Streptomyces sp. AM 4-1-1]|uniref:methyltransferase domain-containing protein n=1 Tax=Streptomyces sp. AM 4-1-1 TaxID=3028710 RepID=UPI0023BA1EE7|nr:methyltransferase domain-containing protein [Streptomyces sp. AM 4-1-1]WEH36704.1 methyltransferase domain-containing protein [Streptomyces sp. AM 4-1-1]
MTEAMSHMRSLERSRASRTRRDRPKTFLLDGREWDLLDDVFAPPFSPSSAIAMRLAGLSAPAAHWRGSFLEIGSGTGVGAVLAALAGCEHVVAVDINARAVENTAVNARRHGVADRVCAVRSDLFSALPTGERYDTVFWHSNFVYAPDDYTCESDHDRAYVDPGYRAHRMYLIQAPERLADAGRVLLHFSDRGDIRLLHSIAAHCDRELLVVRSERNREGHETVEHVLFEVRVASAGT